MTDLLELAARVEAATGPDSSLDIDICIAVEAYSAEGYKRFGKQYPLGYYIAHGGIAKPYTASLDAALSLVPEGLEWSLEFFPGDLAEYNHSDAEIWLDEDNSVIASAATPALAIVASALRARAAAKAMP